MGQVSLLMVKIFLNARLKCSPCWLLVQQSSLKALYLCTVRVNYVLWRNWTIFFTNMCRKQLFCSLKFWDLKWYSFLYTGMETNFLKVLLCEDMGMSVHSPKLANSLVFTTLMGRQRIQILVPGSLPCACRVYQWQDHLICLWVIFSNSLLQKLLSLLYIYRCTRLVQATWVTIVAGHSCFLPTLLASCSHFMWCTYPKGGWLSKSVSPWILPVISSNSFFFNT